MTPPATFPSYRQVNRPLEFRGLVGRYIIYAGLIAALSLLLCAVLYLLGLNSWVCLSICLGGGSGGIALIYQLSNRYGEWGWHKHLLARQTPKIFRFTNRLVFIEPTN